MIENMIFDMGNVLIHWYPQLFTQRMGLSQEDEKRIIDAAFGHGDWNRLDEGTLTEQEALRIICKRLPERLHPCMEKLVLRWWEVAFEPVEGMANLIAELKQEGRGIYLLSNAGLNFPNYFPKIPGSDLFDGLYVSAQHKLVKPDREIYEDFLKTFDLKPETCFFTDDREDNIQGAADCGIRGTIFQGTAQSLRETLKKQNILS